jgi:hypothetical protein
LGEIHHLVVKVKVNVHGRGKQLKHLINNTKCTESTRGTVAININSIAAP